MLLKFPKGPQCPLTATTHRGQPRAQPSASLGLWERRARTNTAGVGSSVASPVPVQLGKPFLFYHHYYNYLILQAAAVLAGDTHKGSKETNRAGGARGTRTLGELDPPGPGPEHLPWRGPRSLGSLDSGSLATLFS